MIRRDEGGGLARRAVLPVLFALVCLTWGTTWLAIKIAVSTVPPLTSAGLRFMIAFPLFAAFAKVTGAPLTYPRGKGGLFVMTIVAYFLVPYFLIFYGEQYVSSGLTALVFSSMPVFTLIFSALLFRARVSAPQVGGIVIGFVSLAAILVLTNNRFGAASWVAVLGMLAASVMHAFCYVTTKQRGGGISAITLEVLPIGIAGVCLFLLGLVAEHPRLSDASPGSYVAVVYLGLVASVGGFITYFYLLQRMNQIVLSFVFILFPVVALVVSSVYEHIAITPQFVGLCLLLLAGFALTKFGDTGEAAEVLDAAAAVPASARHRS